MAGPLKTVPPLGVTPPWVVVPYKVPALSKMILWIHSVLKSGEGIKRGDSPFCVRGPQAAIVQSRPRARMFRHNQSCRRDCLRHRQSGFQRRKRILTVPEKTRLYIRLDPKRRRNPRTRWVGDPEDATADEQRACERHRRSPEPEVCRRGDEAFTQLRWATAERYTRTAVR